MTHLVGLCGLSGSGKSFVARYLGSRYGFRVVSMGAPIKEMLGALGLTEAQLYGDLKDMPTARLNGRTPRYAMQTLGSEWGRNFMGPDLWLGFWNAKKYTGMVVVDDVRFQNEADAVRLAGGYIIRLSRSNRSRCDNPDHISEALDFEADHIILNGGSKVDLIAKVEHILRIEAGDPKIEAGPAM